MPDGRRGRGRKNRPVEEWTDREIVNAVRTGRNLAVKLQKQQSNAAHSSGNLPNLPQAVGIGNRGCKELMRRGGVMPPAFFDQTRLEEDEALLSGEDNFIYHHFGILAAKALHEPIVLSASTPKVLGYLVLRFLLVRRRRLSAVIKSNKQKNAFNDEEIKLIDALHLITSGENLGWVIPDTSAADFKQIKKNRVGNPEKWAQGFLRNAITLAEICRRLIEGEPQVVSECTDPFSIEQLRQLNGLSSNGLTLLSGRNAQSRDLPSFGKRRKINFGRILDPNSAELNSLSSDLKQQVPIWLHANRVELSQLLHSQYGQGDNRLISGGVKGSSFHHLCEVR